MIMQIWLSETVFSKVTKYSMKKLMEFLNFLLKQFEFVFRMKEQD